MGEQRSLSGEDLRAYIVNNVDRAVDEGWITAYYQPVVRTLTGEICGVEALARWDDPVYGLLRPDEFISVLEKARLIHKLDSCIIRQVCRDYAESTASGRSTVPGSFNLSRLDFQLCDIHQVIEDAIHRYKIPKDALHVEITESMMEKNEKRMHSVIDRFVDFGLNVWMDDFGSGYSSLNVLKDFNFETIKIDMVFLKSFDIRSREIIKSVIDMAKRIGVHTLAEGVETEEQLAFLRSIGCEKAQGYLFSEPVLLEQMRKKVGAKGYVVEPQVRRKYYHDIGRVNVLSPTPFVASMKKEEQGEYQEGQYPLAIIECDEEGSAIRFLYVNENYLTALRHAGFASAKEVEDDFARHTSSVSEKLFSLMKSSREDRKRRSMDFFIGSSRCYSMVQWIADYPGGSAYLSSLQNLTDDQMISKSNMLADALQSMCRMYERITLIDLNTMRSSNLYETNQTITEYNRRPTPEEIRDFAENEIYPDDREEFLQFTDIDTIERRLGESKYHFISSALRTRSVDRTYAWMSYVTMFAGDPAERKILMCSRRISDFSVGVLRRNHLEDQRADAEIARWGFPTSVLWENFTRSADTAFFWKDMDLKYLGVNRKFLEYYGMETPAPILGKTDEEIGWKTDPEPSRKEEERIVREGISTYLAPGNTIRKGEVRNIISSKFPLYQDGRIVGLIGYLLDMTDLKDMGLEASQLHRNDAITGSLGLIGVVESVLRYQDAFVFDSKDFAMIIFDIHHFHIFAKEYGKKWCNQLLREFSDKIRAIMGMDTVFGRLNADHFLMVRQISAQKEIDDLIEKVSREAETIKEVDGIPCTIYLLHGYAKYSQKRDLQATLLAAEQMLAENKKKRDEMT